MKRLFLFLILPLALSCQSASESSDEATAPQMTVRDIDFANWTYPSPSYLCEGNLSPCEVTLVNREAEVSGQDGSTHSLYAGDPLYADVTGDGVEEAIIELSDSYINTPVSPDVYVYTIGPGDATMLLDQIRPERIFDDYDRHYSNGWVFSSYLSTHVGTPPIVIPRAGYRDGDARCCPSYEVRFAYRWDGTSFVLDGRPQKLPFPER